MASGTVKFFAKPADSITSSTAFFSLNHYAAKKRGTRLVYLAPLRDASIATGKIGSDYLTEEPNRELVEFQGFPDKSQTELIENLVKNAKN